ncbi:MAG: glucokinase [Bacteroidota bacterium]|nr:glucokinase [Bacteroidota bacterium]
MLIPLKKYPSQGDDLPSRIIVAGDIGATKCNLALYRLEKDQFNLLHEAHFLSHAFNGMAELLDAFLLNQPSPGAICLGVAGPVLQGVARLSNLHWEIDSRELSEHFSTQNIFLINDLESTGYGLAVLSAEDILTIQEGLPSAEGNAAVIAPGTGLGEAGLFWDGATYQPFATEGGHCDFSPRTALDIELYNHLSRLWDHVSWERLISGPGILNIYRFLRDIKKREEPAWIGEKLKADFSPALISSNSEDCPICKETMEIFVRFLAYESANLVLKMKATGGLFIGGGIVPHISSLVKTPLFQNAFCQYGRLSYLMEEIPVKLILNEKTALLGAAWYAGHCRPWN